jgi:flavodoxin
MVLSVVTEELLTKQWSTKLYAFFEIGASSYDQVMHFKV